MPEKSIFARTRVSWAQFVTTGIGDIVATAVAIGAMLLVSIVFAFFALAIVRVAFRLIVAA